MADPKTTADAGKMQRALEWIAQMRYGLDLQATDAERAEYWMRLATEYRAVARRALQDAPDAV